MSEVENKTLGNNYFEDQASYSAFSEILDTLDHLSPKYISRREYNNKKWNFIEKNWKDRIADKYILYLPVDLKIHELPSIILRVNKLTFWDDLPEYASTNELKVKITMTIDFLLSKNLKNNKVDQKAIKKYIKLYSQLFWKEEANKLNKVEYRNSIIQISNNDRYKSYEQKLISIGTKENLSNLLDETEQLFVKELDIHFWETFFERWINMLRMGMKTYTQKEHYYTSSKKEALDMRNEAAEIWAYSYTVNPKTREFEKEKIIKNTEILVLREKIDNLDDEERFLRDKMQIDAIKALLNEYRDNWDIDKINELELFASNRVLETLYEYPYKLLDSDWGYKPSNILSNKEVYCVWFSLLWHSFLSELWIKHKWLIIPNHSALEVIIWWKSYYFDWSFSEKITAMPEMSWSRTDNKKFKYWNIIREWKSGDPEKILMQSIYNNLSINLSKKRKYEEYLVVINKEINLYPNEIENYKTKSLILRLLNKLEDSLIVSNQILEIEPNKIDNYKDKIDILIKLDKLEEALIVSNQILEIEPSKINNYVMNVKILHNLNRNEEVLILSNKVLEIDPNNIKFVYYKSTALLKLSQYSEAMQLSNIVIDKNPNNIWWYYVKWYSLINLKDYKNALITFKQALKIDKNNKETKRLIDKCNELIKNS